MKIDETTYNKMPPHLQALFHKSTNPERDEVLEGFPNSKTTHIEKPSMCDEEANTWEGTFQRNRGARGYDGDGSAARFFYTAKVSPSERNLGMEDKNSHPTLKPIALTEYLARLILPPEEYAPRRLLVPFAGSGSEMLGAHQAGWEEIVGVELSEEYTKIAEARLKYWTSIPKQLELK